MQLVIDIQKRIYKSIINADKVSGDWDNGLTGVLCKGVANGTPLPKGHGCLIDRSKIYQPIKASEDNLTGAGMTYYECECYNDGIDDMYKAIFDTPTIIEADEE